MASDYLVVSCDYLIGTRYTVFMTSHYLVGTRESLVVTCDSLVVTRYYLVVLLSCVFPVLSLLCFW